MENVLIEYFWRILQEKIGNKSSKGVRKLLLKDRTVVLYIISVILQRSFSCTRFADRLNKSADHPD